MKPVTFSKSSFAAGLQCPKRIWIEKRAPELLPPVSAGQQAIFDQGHDVGAWSQRLFPTGIHLRGELEFESHLQASRDALAARRPLFEPAFSIPGAYARADILTPVGTDEWELLEIKSASKVWDGDQIKAVYLEDIAFQLHVYRAAGLKIRRTLLVFLNNQYVRQGEIDPRQLFRQEDVTVQAERLLPSIPGQLMGLTELLQRSDAPEMEIGPHCDSPYTCSLKDYCWKAVPPDSVFSLVRGGKKAWAWWSAGIIRITDLPVGGKYSDSQAIQIVAARQQEAHVDVPAVRQFIDGLRYPLSFLDFETIMPAVPLFDGTRPYSQVPFQFSLHVQNASGQTPNHLEFLAAGDADPRPKFLEALRAALPSGGSIVCYNSGFETLRLKELAAQFPGYAEWIGSVLPRFTGADLWKPFQSFAVYHPRQQGGASLKDVLPAFTDLAYDDLAIQEGGTASRQFLSLLQGKVQEGDVTGIRRNLLEYCQRDTFAMVELLAKLQQLAGSASLPPRELEPGSQKLEGPDGQFRVSTPQGEITLIQPPVELLRDIRRYLPFGALRYLPPQQNADFGLVMQCGEREVFAVKQQPIDCDERQGRVTYQANCILIAHSLVAYLQAGFSGMLMPCPYIRKKGFDLVESGIAYIGAPDPQGIECLDRPFEPSFDGQFGHGFTTLMTTFIRALQQSSRESGIGLGTCIGLDVRPRSHLETLGFGFMVTGGKIVCLKTHVSEDDPVWTILRATGVTEVYHVPSIPAGISETDLAVAKPSVQ